MNFYTTVPGGNKDKKSRFIGTCKKQTVKKASVHVRESVFVRRGDKIVTARISPCPVSQINPHVTILMAKKFSVTIVNIVFRCYKELLYKMKRRGEMEWKENASHCKRNGIDKLNRTTVSILPVGSANVHTDVPSNCS